MAGAFKLEHLQPFRPILFLHISICMNFILGGQFLLLQRANSEKREFIQPQKWMTERGLRGWVIPIGVFAAI